MAQTAGEKSGHHDIVVSYTGVLGTMESVGDLDDATWNQVIEVNLTGSMRSMRAAIPEFFRQGKGVFVTIASVGPFSEPAQGPRTRPRSTARSASRGTSATYTPTRAFGPSSSPREVNTEIGTGIQFHPGGAAICSTGPNINPRMGEPEEIAEVALIPALDDSSFVNGATIVVDAGRIAY